MINTIQKQQRKIKSFVSPTSKKNRFSSTLLNQVHLRIPQDDAQPFQQASTSNLKPRDTMQAPSKSEIAMVAKRVKVSKFNTKKKAEETNRNRGIRTYYENPEYIETQEE